MCLLAPGRNSLRTNAHQFEVRVCPALKAKHDASVAARSGSNNDDEQPHPAAKRAKPDDPFEGPYTSDLLIGKVGQEEGEEKMVALLNKFSVVPGASPHLFGFRLLSGSGQGS